MDGRLAALVVAANDLTDPTPFPPALYRCYAALQVSVGGYDWGMFQFAVVQLEAVEHGPNLPQKVWGALDPEGT